MAGICTSAMTHDDLFKTGRLQKLLGRRECIDEVSMRTEKIIGRGPDGRIIVND